MKSVKLGDIAEFRAGYGFPKKFQGKSAGEFPFAKVGDISEVARRGEIMISSAPNYVGTEELNKIGAKTLPTGSIVFAKIGEAIRQNFRAITATEMVVDNNVMGMVPDSKLVSTSYLFHFMRQLDLYQYTSATSVPALRKSRLETLPIPLPPLDEQKRIAAVLDAADALRAKRRAALAKLDTLLQSVFLEMFGDPVTNPMGWEVVKLGDVANFVGGGTPRRDNPDYYVGDVCWATSKDMKGEFLCDTVEHITLKAIEESATKLVPTGSILVGVKSKILLKRLPLLITRVPTCFSQDIKGIILSNELSTSYTARHLRVGQRSLLSLARGVNTEGLTLRHLRGYSLMLPPRSLMDKYVLIEQAIQDCLSGMYSQLELQDKLFASVQQLVFSP